MPCQSTLSQTLHPALDLRVAGSSQNGVVITIRPHTHDCFPVTPPTYHAQGAFSVPHTPPRCSVPTSSSRNHAILRVIQSPPPLPYIMPSSPLFNPYLLFQKSCHPHCSFHTSVRFNMAQCGFLLMMLEITHVSPIFRSNSISTF